MRLLAIGIVGLLAAAAGLVANAIEQEPIKVHITPKGPYRLESAGGDEMHVFVVMKSSGQRNAVSDQSAKSALLDR